MTGKIARGADGHWRDITNPVPGDPYHLYNPPAPEAVTVDGVGPDASTKTNAAGASQSAIPYAVVSLDAGALLAAARVAAAGDAKYGVDDWRGIPTRDHLNHLLTHVLAYLAGDRSDEHLSHAICRALMAYACEDK